MSIRLIVSDSDGTLICLREIHYESLNKALAAIDPKYVISTEDHVKIFDGLSTKKKLKLLSETKGLPADKINEVSDLKQKFTVELLKTFTNINNNIFNVVSRLKQEGYLFYVASNAVRVTVETGLEKAGITHLVDKIYSNEDVVNPKPSPEIYLKCMIDAGVDPKETLIIEDSRHGRDSAVRSGAYVCGLDNSFDFEYDRIKSIIDSAKNPIKWAGKADLNVLIPMSGLGSRFAQQGYKLPKPLIDVNGKPMIQTVVDNLNMDANFIFIVQKTHYEQYNLGVLLPLIVPGCKIVQTEGLTQGAACSALLAKELINNGKHLIIANSDQYVEWDSCDFMYSMISSEMDGGILTFKANESKWSYAKTNEDGFVTEVAEKKVISEDATIGIYYWKKGSDFVKYAEQMIEKDIRTNGEHYICPVFNEAIQDNKKIKTFPAVKMHGLGTPEDLEKYLENVKA